MLEKTLESALDDHFAIVPKDLFEEAQEKAFEELDYEECTEEQCIMMIKEFLQVENAFQLVLMEEDGDTQISLTWNDLDQKRVEEEYCEGCKTKQLRKSVVLLVDKLIRVKILGKEEVVQDLDDNLYADNFDKNNINVNWKTNICEGKSISFQGGKAKSTSNGCFMSLNKSIDGEVFLEMDVFKEGYEDHGCWDFSIQWKRNLNIILLFDKNGYDRIGYVKSNDHCSNSIIFDQMPSTTKNGKIQLSIFEKGFQVKYIDSLGNQITTSNSDLDNPYSKYFQIGLAAYSNSPRMIDNLKIKRL